MNRHPYLRAYMCGIVVPTVLLLVVMSAFTIARFVYNVPIQIERLIVFPMALIPNLWGLWNMLYVRLNKTHRISIGLHGPLLVFVIVPVGYSLAKLLGVELPFQRIAMMGVPAALTAYYLVWKYIVSFFNRLQEIP
jgi:hypothetical protein